MEMKQWLELMKQTKASSTITGYGTEVKVIRYSNTRVKLFTEEVCNCCKREMNSNGVIVEFKKEARLTIFQAEVLYMVLVQKKRPSDYSKYDECVAGIRFVENINSYEIVSLIEVAQ